MVRAPMETLVSPCPGCNEAGCVFVGSSNCSTEGGASVYRGMGSGIRRGCHIGGAGGAKKACVRGFHVTMALASRRENRVHAEVLTVHLHSYAAAAIFFVNYTGKSAI